MNDKKYDAILIVSEDCALNVNEEVAKVYWDNFKNVSGFIRPQLSAAMMKEIFDKMVLPAIDRVRSLDREHKND